MFLFSVAGGLAGTLMVFETLTSEKSLRVTYLYFYIFRKFFLLLVQCTFTYVPHHHLYYTASPRICLSQNACLSLTCVRYCFQNVAVSFDKFLAKKWSYNVIWRRSPHPLKKKNLWKTHMSTDCRNSWCYFCGLKNILASSIFNIPSVIRYLYHISKLL